MRRHVRAGLLFLLPDQFFYFMYKNSTFLLVCMGMVAGPLLSFSQPVFSITGSSNFYISAGQTVSLDSLVLTPSAAYNMTSNNLLTHNSTLTHSSSTPSINLDYSFSTTLTGYSGAITVYYLTSELNSLSPATLQINAYGTGWTNYAGTVGTNFAMVSGLTNISFKELSLASSSAPLPLVWLSVTATRQSGGVSVQWTTADESNVKDFQVQKSADGVVWSDPSAPQQALNTPGPNVYNWLDPSLQMGTQFYRILQTDDDGALTYSTIVVIGMAAGNAVQIYPNPVTSVLVVEATATGPGLTSVRIHDEQGRVVLQALTGGLRQYQANISGLARGFYTVVVDFADGSSVARTFVKL